MSETEREPSSSSAAVRIIAGVIAAATLVAMAHVWLHLQVLTLGYQLSKQHQRRQALLEAQQRLTLELRTRSDMAAVERIARDRLRMAPPDPRTLRHVALATPEAAP